MQRLGDLLVAGVFVSNLYLRKFDDAEVAETAQSLLVLGHALREVGGVHLANGNQINVLHGVPRSKFNVRADLVARLCLNQDIAPRLDARA